MRRRLVITVIAVGAAGGCAGAGCGDNAAERRPIRAASVALVPVPRAVAARCAALAAQRDVRVLCPTRLPRARWSVRYRSLARGPTAYLTDLEAAPRGGGAAFHVLAGGRRGRFSLDSSGGRWPVDAPAASRTCCARPGDLGLIGAEEGERAGTFAPVRLRLRRRAAVARHPALLLTVAGFPAGGIHGGHVAVVWNQGSDGYVLSMHFGEHAGLSGRAQESAVLEAATSMSAARAGA